MIYASIAAFAAFFGLLWIMRRDTLKRGNLETKKEITEDVLHDIHLVKTARDRLRAVDDADARLREKYTRK